MIDATAKVAPGARILDAVEVGPFCVIGPEVSIGAGTRLHSHVVIQGRTTLGRDNTVFPFTTLGLAPQHTGHAAPGVLRIGSRNVFREHTSVHLAATADGATIIGDGCFVMGHCHVAHDCVLKDHVILTQGTGLSGHCVIETGACMGGQTGAHQYVRVGRLALVGGKSAAFKDIPPFAIVKGIPSAFFACNRIGLERAGVPEERIDIIERALAILFRDGHETSRALIRIRQECEPTEEIAQLVAFIAASQRGICR